MKVFICGDIHGLINISKLASKSWPEGKELTADDMLIILGDTGINWSNDLYNRNDIYLKNWLNAKPWTTLFIDGNHENFERLFAIKTQPFFGGLARHVSESIFHLDRGSIFTFGNKKIFTMGGGFSIDKERRKNRISWWEEEIPSVTELNRGLKILESNGNKVDFVLTHSCSNKVFELFTTEFGYNMNYKNKDEERPLRIYFDYIEENVKFKEWHFGHFHDDIQLDKKHFCHFENKPVRII